MARNVWQDVLKVLPYVEKPSRYVNGEWNSIHKPHEESKVSVALAYPDTYEVGLSNLGLAILYEILNDREDIIAERVYAPWLDMESLMRKGKIPLFSLESHLPISCFDLLGFSLQTEMTYTNVLNMLDLAGIPLRSCERDESHPLVIGGGPCVFNPEPLAPFFDLFVIGEAEEAILEIVEECARDQRPETGDQKEELLKRLAEIPGVYVPQFHEPNYDTEGRVTSINPVSLGLSPKVLKRAVANLNDFMFPKKPVVPFMNVIHDRCSLEIMRGCMRGCRFCQAGMIYRPAREREPQLVKQFVKEVVKKTGYEEVSLASLSSTDYSSIDSLVSCLAEDYKAQGISISLPSLRADKFSVNLANQVSKVRKTGLTFAPEAGSQRLRDVINKCAEEKEILNTVRYAFEAGWRKIKLYFMIGLPTETENDLEDIIKLTRKIVQIGLDVVPRKEHRLLDVIAAVSSFVPKAHTPFQWVAQANFEDIEKKQEYLKRNLRLRHTTLKWHDARQGIVEGLLARGDRRVSEVILEAWRGGAKFDAWTEVFDFSLWQEALAKSGVSLDFYTTRERTKEENFGWDHIDAGLNRDFLWSEYQKGLESRTTEDCRLEACTDCGVCDELGIERPNLKAAIVR